MSSEKSRRLEGWTRVLILVLTAATLLILWSTFLFSTSGERDKSLALETERLTRSARVFTSRIDSLLGKSRLVLNLLTHQAGAHSEDPADLREFLSLVETVRREAGSTLDLRAVDRQGYLFYFEGDKSERLVSVADRDYYLVHQSPSDPGFYLGLPVASRVSGSWGMVASQAMPPGGKLAVLHTVIPFSAIDALVVSLTDWPGETVSIYRDDGQLLYRHPFPETFPVDPAPNDWTRTHALGLESGILTGETTRVFQRGEETPIQVVVAKKSEFLAREWESWFRVQLTWMAGLTVVILTAAGGIIGIQSRLRKLRMVQEELARIDPLTGLLNRRAFLDQCAVERLRTERNPGPLALALLDLDHFKQVNDRFGHQVGDQALRDFGAALVRTLRVTDSLARIGGEEFSVLLPGTDGPTAMEIAERLRDEVAAIELPEGHLTTSIGVAVWDGSETFDLWYHRADQALYRAKAAGRNRVSLA